MSDPKRLIDYQVREIRARNDTFPLNDITALLADREALLADFQAELTRRMALHLKQADEIEELRAENAKLRKVVKYAPSGLDPTYYGMAEQIAYRDALDALDTKEATDDSR